MNTTKKLTLLLLAMLACMSASAQVKFGAKVGLDVTNFWGKETGHQMVLNYQAGLLMEYKYHPRFAIAPEVVFAAQGGQEKVNDVSDAGYLTESYKRYHTNYINVPVMLKFYVAPDLSIDFGPQVGFNVYSKHKTGNHDDTDYKDMTKAVDFGLGLGATGDIDKNTFLQVRYTLGLTRAFKEEHRVYYNFENYRKNANIQLAFGVKF